MHKTCRALMALLFYRVVWEVEHGITLEGRSSSERLDSLFGISIELDDDLLQLLPRRGTLVPLPAYDILPGGEVGDPYAGIPIVPLAVSDL